MGRLTLTMLSAAASFHPLASIHKHSLKALSILTPLLMERRIFYFHPNQSYMSATLPEECNWDGQELAETTVFSNLML